MAYIYSMLACTLPRDVLAHRAFIALALTCSGAPIHAPFLHPARSGHRALPFPGPAQPRSHRRSAIMFCYSTTPLPPHPPSSCSAVHPHPHPPPTPTHIHTYTHTRLPGPGSSVPAAGCGGPEGAQRRASLAGYSEFLIPCPPPRVRRGRNGRREKMAHLRASPASAPKSA